MKKLLFALALVPAIAGAEVVNTFQGIVDALAVAQSGEEVVVADGTYEVTAALTVPNGVTLRSEKGREAVIFTMPEGGMDSGVTAVIAKGAAKLSTFCVEGFTFSNIVMAAGGPIVNLGYGGTLRASRVTRCTLKGNNYGGSVGCGKGAKVEGCVIDNNATTGTGGTSSLGYQNDGGDNGAFTVENTLICSNQGGIYVNAGEITLKHCTIIDNYAAPCSAVLYNNNRSVTFKDCVMCFSSHPGGDFKGTLGSTVSKIQVNYCYGGALNLSDLKDGSANIITSGDCCFVNPQAGDYHLKAGSVLIGAASDGGDIGCHAYDAGYEPSYPVVNLKPTDDMAAALAAAPEGSVVNLAEGTYDITSQLLVDKPIRLIGAGRGKTIFKSDGEDHRILKIHHYRAYVEGITFRDSWCTGAGSAVWIGALGGCLAKSRITGCTCASAYGSLAIGNYGIAYDVVIDGNAYIGKDKEGNWIDYPEACAGINFWKGQAEKDTTGGVADHCLVCANRGYGLYLNNGNTTTSDNNVRNCTIVGELGYENVGNTRGFTATRTIFLASTVAPFNEKSSCGGKVTYNSCCYASVGGTPTTNDCVVTIDPGFVNPRAGDYHLRADSPCIGAASDGSDIGCYAYDPDYEPTYATVTLKDGDDLAAAVAAAEPGTDILLGAGTYELSARLGISKPIRISGESRDSVFVQPTEGAGQFRLLTLSHPLARIENLTMRRSSGGCVDVAKGGTVENCRMTECACGTSNVEGLGARITIGHVNRCLVDNNTDLNKNRDTSFVAVKSNIPSSNDLLHNYGLFENSLVTGNVADNTNSSGHQWRGYAVHALRANVCSAGFVRNVTVVGNSLARSLTTDGYANAVNEFRNCIFWGNPVAYSANAKTTGAIDNCYLYQPNEAAQQYATNCSTDDPLVRKNGKLKPSSPCIGQAVTGRYISRGLDFAGNPRVREDGTQDIGCNQWMPSGLMMLVK